MYEPTDEKEIDVEEVVEELKNLYRAYIATDNPTKAALFRDAAMLIEELSGPKWNYVGHRPPDKNWPYLVYVHAPDDIQNDPVMFVDGDPNEKIDWGFISMAHFNKGQGGIWEMEYDRTAYGADLSKIDTKNEYYISHWMEMPRKPNV